MKKASELSKQGYQAPESSLPESLSQLEYADYAQIQMKDDQALWQGEDLPFNLKFFHEGMHYNSAVTMHTIVDGKVQDLSFDPGDFDYGDLDIPEEDLEGLGFAGFKVTNAINDAEVMDEVMAFQGASYFRAVGRHQTYGTSGRGLAIDTALPSGEEFPAFREFWVVKPSPDSQYLTVFALLDSPSLTGAYRFVLRPGEDTVVDVSSMTAGPSIRLPDSSFSPSYTGVSTSCPSNQHVRRLLMAWDASTPPSAISLSWNGAVGAVARTRKVKNSTPFQRKLN